MGPSAFLSESPILVVVDVQVGFLNESSSAVIPSILKVIAAFHELELPIILTKFINSPGSPFESLLDWKDMHVSPEIDLHDSLSGSFALTTEKSSYTAFTTELEDLIRRETCRTILICGISTESCVLKTALDAFEKGLRPVVISDACASDQGIEMHLHALEILELTIGARQLKTVDEVVRELSA